MFTLDQQAQIRQIEEWMRACGYSTPSAFARAAGVAPSTLNRKFYGDDSNLFSARTMIKLEKHARATSKVPFPEATPTTRIPVKGEVQAGYWVEAQELLAEEQYIVHYDLPEIYKGFPVFALKVRGQSINRILPDGSHAICIKLYDWNEQPIDGDYVVVQQQNPQGLVEATIKRLRIDSDGVRWLWPASDSPEHQAPIRMNGTEDEVEIWAIVIGAQANLLNR